jgi:hypothetical protein
LTDRKEDVQDDNTGITRRRESAKLFLKSFYAILLLRC